jgi:hypothetical protein
MQDPHLPKPTEISWEQGGVQQLMRFDAVTRQAHESTARPTDHPIEEGADVSDHIQPGLDSLSMEVVVSNEPISDPETQMDGAVGTVRSVEVPSSLNLGPLAIPLTQTVSVFAFSQEFDRVRTVYDLLRELKANGTRIDIHTTLRDYTDMVLTRVAPVRQASTGDALFATVDAREISVVSSETVSVPEPEETRGETNRNRGRQNTAESSNVDNPRNASILSRFGSAVFGI